MQYTDLGVSEMNVRKKIFIVIIAIILLFVIGILIFISPWLILAVGLYLSPAPPKPEIKYGEFNFKLVYEISGEVRTIDDTIVCEFDGFNIDEGRGKTRRWKEHFKNEQNNELYAFRMEYPEEYKHSKPEKYNIVLQNIDHYKVLLIMADAEYFMGEPENKQTGELEPTIQVYDKSVGYFKDPIQSDEFLKEYNFKIISWYCDSPIENHFK